MRLGRFYLRIKHFLGGHFIVDSGLVVIDGVQLVVPTHSVST